MMPVYPTMWQMYPASGVRDLLDYLVGLELTDEEFAIGSGYLDPTFVQPCSVDGCERPKYVGGLCSPHYQQVRYRARKAKQSD